MDTGEADIVHWDAILYPDIPVGRPDVVRDYLDHGGMFGWGGVPQNEGQLLTLVLHIGMNFDIEKIGMIIENDSFGKFARDFFDTLWGRAEVV